MSRDIDRGFGWLKDPPDRRDRRYGAPREVLEEGLPNLVDLRPEMPPIFDQDALSSCTSNASAACVQHAEAKALDPDAGLLSRLFVYYHARRRIGTVESDSGAFIRDAFKVHAKRGVPREHLWPYDIARFRDAPGEAGRSARHHRVVEYRSVDETSEEDMRTCLAEGYPFAFGFPVYRSFLDVDANGWWSPGFGESIIGYHAVVAVGYTTRSDISPWPGGHWIVRNSWGEYWGDGGHFYVPPGFMAAEAWDCWTIRRVER